MIDLYTYATSNGKRVAIMLEECDLDYQVHKVDLRRGEQKTTEFLQLNPSGRIPVIVDNEKSLVLTQSSAILLYLAEKTGRFIANDSISKAKVLEWFLFHATDVAITSGNAFYLINSEWLEYRESAQRLKDRVYDWYQYFNQQLSENKFLVDNQYSIADIAMLPSVVGNDDVFFDKYAHIARWKDEVLSRPAVQRGLNII
ncbi:MAG: glutathione S-transferase family protein [Piscirickettsiaceae bacterium]|nr:glutathione S-transferase family protein [Piscirickettsiaceae bacterium]